MDFDLGNPGEKYKTQNFLKDKIWQVGATLFEWPIITILTKASVFIPVYLHSVL